MSLLKPEFRAPRSTYSRKNALQFKTLFDRILNEEKPLMVPVFESGYTLLSLRQKINDGLLWLINNYEPSNGEDIYTKADYQRLKLFTKIRVKEEGILLDYSKKMIDGAVVVKTPIERAEELVIWKSRLLTFLDNTETKLFLTGLNLKKEDIEFVEKILDGTSFEWSVSEDFIKIVK